MVAIAASVFCATAPAGPAAEWRPGVGAGITGIGRFGYVKGDGLLDVTYNRFGVVEKNYLAGHPRSRTGKPWAVSFQPPLAKNDKELPPSEWPQRLRDECQANWISVKWTSDFEATGDGFGRKQGDRFRYVVSYSMVSPGILVETDDKVFRLASDGPSRYGELDFSVAGTVRTAALTGTEGMVYDATRDGALSDNWLLLTGADTFPDVPLLLVLKRSPSRIRLEAEAGRAAALVLEFPEGVGHVILCTPSGMRAFDAGETRDATLRAKIRSRCVFWSKALLAFVTDASERYAIDRAAGTVTIEQTFVPRILEDAWHSTPIKTAPYPPALSLAAMTCDQVRFLDAADAAPVFETRYGQMRVVAGRCRSSYQLPLPPYLPRVPIPPKDSELRRQVAEKFRIGRPDGNRPLPSEFHPGLWSRIDRSCVDVASLFGNWFVTWPYLSEDAAANLRLNAGDILPDLLDDQERFAETELFRSIQQTPADMGKLTRPIWFPRQEPFSGKEYILSYTQPNIRQKGERITRGDGWFTDVEWGNGFGLDGVRQTAQLSGGWDVAERNWRTVEGMHGLFELLQDWALLSVSGCEGGMRWTDPSSYPGYLAYISLAWHLRKDAEHQDGLYLLAKHAALRVAMFNGGLYLARFYDAKPWIANHCFVEQDSGYKVPEPQRDGRNIYPADWLRGENPVVQRNSLYSLVAEGVCYECPDLFFTLMPDATHQFLDAYLRLFPEWREAKGCEGMNTRHSPSGGITLYEAMLFMLRDPHLSTDALRSQLSPLLAADLIPKYLKGFYGRYDGCQEYAAALLETRDDPAWIADWRGLELSAPEYDRASRTVTVRVGAAAHGELLLGGRKPRAVRLDAAPLREAAEDAPGTWWFEGDLVRIRVPGNGTLAVEYE
ncbi:MAG: hypothetical protein A3K19_32325 [Lentisphaerae bacterium RIFOXYB12_FULL_65_16]|nr:MAG: hypothetical protein A3K19_32325 [Lentisphaerae bacterium RIFOXYB12_FULL_65_16]